MRLDLDNENDKKFLEKRIGKERLSHTLSTLNKANDITIASSNSDSTRAQGSSSSDDKKRRSKYGNTKVFCNTFDKTIDSKWEHDLLHHLFFLEQKHIITDLKHDCHFNLVVNDVKICRFELDFEFNWLNQRMYVDAKSPATCPPGFNMKVKLFKAIYSYDVQLSHRKQLGIISEMSEEPVCKVDVCYGKKSKD